MTKHEIIWISIRFVKHSNDKAGILTSHSSLQTRESKIHLVKAWLRLGGIYQTCIYMHLENNFFFNQCTFPKYDRIIKLNINPCHNIFLTKLYLYIGMIVNENTRCRLLQSDQYLEVWVHMESCKDWIIKCFSVIKKKCK